MTWLVRTSNRPSHCLRAVVLGSEPRALGWTSGKVDSAGLGYLIRLIIGLPSF